MPEIPAPTISTSRSVGSLAIVMRRSSRARGRKARPPPPIDTAQERRPQWCLHHRHRWCAAATIGAVAIAVPRQLPLPVAGRITTPARQRVVAAAVLPVAVSALWLALASDHLERPVGTGLYRAYIAAVPMLVGVLWWRRRPASLFGPLLIGSG